MAGMTAKQQELEAEAVQEARVCTATRTNGEPCKSTLVDDSGLCIAHRRSPLELAAGARAAGLRSGEVRKERAKSFRDRLRDEIEERYEDYAQAFHRGVKADDSRIAVQSATAGLAEAYGRPLQPTREEGGMIFAHPLLSQADAEALNAAKNGKEPKAQ